MSDRFNIEDFQDCINPIVAFGDIVYEMREGSIISGPGESGLMGLSCCVAEVLKACISESKRRFEKAISEQEE